MPSDAGERENKAAAEEQPQIAPATPPAASPAPSDWETRFKYLLADFDNFRRRSERERAGTRREAEADLLRRLIPLVEGFQKAESAGKSLPSSDPLRRGLELLGRELGAIFESLGFSPVARVGETFRSEEHEAVGEAVGTQDVADGEIAEVVQQGYRFQGGLLRPAKVLVARAPKGAETPAAPTPDPGSGGDHTPSTEESSP
ncbi:MAG: nucleotide exchange factor GrpE [Thermoplasmata archaeon]|nr:nucleotide exchange factor GrpE [Thermoplasmata archaeon]